MEILGIQYSFHEIIDLTYFTVLLLTLPVGLIAQLYMSIKSYQEAAALPIVNEIRNTGKKKKKVKAKKSK